MAAILDFVGVIRTMTLSSVTQNVDGENRYSETRNLTDVNGSTNFICYRRDFVIPNMRNDFDGPKLVFANFRDS